MNIKIWIQAFRLRTLPLALSSIFMGSFLAAFRQNFQNEVLYLSILTTIFLQILSNLANDYGDSVHGADSQDRKGPSRAVQSGQISALAMRNAIGVFVVLSLVSGLSLLWFADISLQIFGVFLSLGILSILAAITYTAGKKPYGYAGLGDISVMLFFGLVGVLGVYFLHTKSFEFDLLLPALSCGFLATGVLNVNNIRDIESDKKAGKKSIPVRIGRQNAVFYHWFLLFGAVFCAFAFIFLNFKSGYQFLFLMVLPMLGYNAWAIKTYQEAHRLDPFLKQLALASLQFVLLFGFGNLL